MVDPSKLEIVLFDFGGVISPEGFQLGILKLSMLFNRDFEEMYEIVGRVGTRDTGYARGEASEEEFWKKVAEELGVDEDLSKYHYLFVDNFLPRKEVLENVKSIMSDYDVGIFSDQTNWIFEIDDEYDFLKYFDYKFISYQRGVSKHYDEFYELPLQELGTDAEEILIIDDKQKVLDKAKELGYQTYKFESISALERLLDRF